MKYLFLTAIMFSAILSSNAQTKVAGDSPYTFAPTSSLAITGADIVGRQSKQFDGEVQAAAWQSVFTTEASYFFHYTINSPASTVIEYDQASNSLSLVRTSALFAADNSISTRVGVMRSNNDGQSWTFDVLQNIVGFLGMPNMAQIRNGTDPLAWPIFIYGVGYGQTGSVLGHYTSYYRADGSVQELPFSSPPSGKPNYQWSAADLAVDKENNSILGVSQLGVVTNSGAQYGEYGFFNFGLDFQDFVKEGTVDAFGTSVFRQISPPNPNSTLGTAPLMDVDSDNRIYVAFNNLMPTGDNRTVAVATSEDQGVTWSALNVMPTSLINEFKTSIGVDVLVQFGLLPYQGSAFIVTNPNEFSYFYRAAAGPFVAGDTTQFNIQNHLVIEARYSGGVWSLSRAADLAIGLGIEGVRLEYPEYSIDDARVAFDSLPRVVVDAASRGIELEVAKSGDGNLVIKYLDQVPGRIIEINPPVLLMTVTDAGDTVEASAPLDTLAWTDIFVASRPLSGGDWSAPTNVSDDRTFNHGTFMPREVPSLQRIPLVQMRSLGNMNRIFANMPAELISSLADRPADVQFAMVNNITGVEQERAYDFRINNVVPNPTLNTSELTFTLDKGAVVSVDLFDVLGNKVRTITTPAFVTAGVHGVSVDVNTLAAGQYHVAITVGGNRLTRSLVVVK